MELSEQDLTLLKNELRRCSPETMEAAIRFRTSGDAGAIPQIVYGIIERYQPATAQVKLADADDNARLVEEFGLDSLTLLEIAMTIEEVLKLRIENEELREIRTWGRLKSFIHAKITAPKAETL